MCFTMHSIKRVQWRKQFCHLLYIKTLYFLVYSAESRHCKESKSVANSTVSHHSPFTILKRWLFDSWENRAMQFLLFKSSPDSSSVIDVSVSFPTVLQSYRTPDTVNWFTWQEQRNGRQWQQQHDQMNGRGEEGVSGGGGGEDRQGNQGLERSKIKLDCLALG